MRQQEPMRPPPQIEIPGLTPRRTWRNTLPSPRPWMLLFLPLLALLAVLPAVALARYTTANSQFCLSCHGVGDTPNRAVRSLVHPGYAQVGCVDCHAKPGQIVYEGYVHGFGAEPERVAPACESCHPEMRGRNDQTGFSHNFANIRITHQQHLDRGATCVTCHSNVAHDLRTPSTNRPRMDYCYSCHATNDSCGKCHLSGPPAGPGRRRRGRSPSRFASSFWRTL